MLCYRDMTFCPFLECAKKDCQRRLTDKVKRNAERGDWPIAQLSEKPDCFEEGK